MVRITTLLFGFFLGLQAYAEVPVEKPAEPEKEKSTMDKIKDNTEDALDYGAQTVHEASRALGETRKSRASTNWNISGNFSILETWVPSKYGITLGYIRSASSTYELEYMRGSLGLGKFGLDIGGFEEQRISLLWRSYNQRNSLSLVYGMYYDTLKITLGSDLLATVSGVPASSVDLVKLSTLGFAFAIGNRWQTKGNFTWGFDWFVINVPLIVLDDDAPFVNYSNDANYREDVEDAMDIIKHIPMFAVFKVQLGIGF